MDRHLVAMSVTHCLGLDSWQYGPVTVGRERRGGGGGERERERERERE